jgi:hypothetical protein
MEAIQQKPQITPALRSLLEELIDYAGLFPPAGLAMQSAVANYAHYKTGKHSWMLGRLVVPVARLTEFEQAWRAMGEPSGWQLSALVAKPESELPAAKDFNAKHAGKLKIDALEVKASTVEEIGKLTIPAATLAYVEIPVAQDPVRLVAAIKSAGLRAKIRTGGLTADMFPDAAVIARFVRRCFESGVAFKATAGLHHPLRCAKPFTYEPGSAVGKMHGFLNVFLAVAYALRGMPVDFLAHLLLEENAREFHFNEDGLQWGGQTLTAAEIESARRDFGIAFGSCSFEEPISDLQSLGLLP